MANTVNKNVIVPEVYSELVREKITGKCKIARCAKVIGDLQGKPGEVLKMPKWAYIGDGKEWTIGTAMDSTQMKQTSTDATIKAVYAPGVDVYDYDNEVEMGNAIEEASSQQAVSIARKMDTDAIACALESPLKVKLAKKNEVSQAEMLQILGMYGDDRNIEDFHQITVHSLFATSLYGMELFVKTTSTTADSGNGIVRGDVIGTFLGIPVVLSDRLYDGTNQEGFIVAMKKNSLGIIPKEAPFCEVARDASKRKNTIYTSDFYAMALIDDTGIVFAKSVIGD